MPVESGLDINVQHIGINVRRVENDLVVVFEFSLQNLVEIDLSNAELRDRLDLTSK